MTGLFSRQTGSFGGMGPWGGHIWRGDDLLYLWQLESQPDSAMRLEDKLVSQNLTTMWASFAKSGYAICILLIQLHQILDPDLLSLSQGFLKPSCRANQTNLKTVTG